MKTMRLLGLLLLFLLPSVASAQEILRGDIDSVGDSVQANVRDVVGVTVTISGDGTGSLSFYHDGSGTCNNAVRAANVSDNTTALLATANGSWAIPNLGYRAICVTATSAITGTYTVRFVEGMTGAGASAAGGGDATEETLAGVLTEDTFVATFPTPAAAGDNQANPTAAKVIAYNECWDPVGQNWDRCQVRSRGLRAQNTIILTSTTTETTLLTAGAAGIFHDLTHLSCSNYSATEVRIDIRDATGGTIRFRWDLAPDGGTFVSNFDEPFSQAVAANNWTAQASASVDSVSCTIAAIKDE